MNSLLILAQTDPQLWASRVTGTWSLTMLLPILLGAAAYLIIQEGVTRGLRWVLLGVLCLIGSIGLAVTFIPTSLDAWILFLFCSLATGGGVAFLTAREPVYAALGFATSVLSTCGVLFMQSALFIAAATMIVYAGATIIIFLFVLMFAQQSELRAYDVRLTNPYLAAAIGLIVMSSIAYCVTADGAFPNTKRDTTRSLSEAMSMSSSPDGLTLPAEVLTSNTPQATSGLGRSLYTDYLIAVELAGTVLLVATIGAIALATKPTAEAN